MQHADNFNVLNFTFKAFQRFDRLDFGRELVPRINIL